MGKGKDVSDFDKGRIVMSRRLGHSITKTAALVGCSRAAVVSIYQKWSKEGDPVNRRQGHGRPRLIDARGERRLARMVESNRKATVAEIAEKVNAGSDKKVSLYTVHRSLLRMGLRCRRPVKALKLTPEQRHKRLQWAAEHRGWTEERWKKVVWSNVSYWEEDMASGCAVGRRKTGAGSMMLWAMFCWESLGPALHVDGTLTPNTYLSIVADHVHSFMETVFPNDSGLFQQDNAPCHTAKIVQEWFEEHSNELEVLTWPPNSPDLNPMEDLWNVLDKQVRSMEAPPRSLQDLKDLLLTFWYQIPQETFRGLVESMPQRVNAVLEAKGGRGDSRVSWGPRQKLTGPLTNQPPSPLDSE